MGFGPDSLFIYLKSLDIRSTACWSELSSCSLSPSSRLHIRYLDNNSSIVKAYRKKKEFCSLWKQECLL